MQNHLEKREGQFYYLGKKLIVDLLTRSDFYYEVSNNKVEGKLRMGTTEIPIGKCEAIFPGWFLYGSVLRKLPDDIDHEWISLVFPSPKVVEDGQFFKTLEKELRGMPATVWKEKPFVAQCTAYPFLVLKDRSGAFADLWMDYGNGREVAIHETRNFAERSLDVERSWEKDLLETGFVKKWRENSQYYCPLDQVTRSLTFLLELGWKIFDYQKKAVYRQGSKNISLELRDQTLFVKGTLSYQDHTANIEHVMGAFNRREHFVTLSEHAVGLIDPAPYWGELPLEEGEIKTRKSHIGLLDHFFSDQEVAREPQVQRLVDRRVATSPHEHFQGALYPYQQEGLNWLYFLYQSQLSGLLADEMGLGKTVQVLALLSRMEMKEPILIVVPTSLLFNWKREFEKFLPSWNVYLHQGKQRLGDLSLLQTEQVIITSYPLLRIDHDLFRSLTCACIILDEAQTIKNRTSQIAQITYRLQGTFRLAITGTPIENRWEDLESLFTFLMPELVTTRHLMKKKIQPFLLRRKKEDVAIQLPEKIEQTVCVTMSDEQQSAYDALLIKTKKGILTKIDREGLAVHRMEILEAILRLRQCCCHPQLIGELGESGKYRALFSDLEAVIEGGRKVLVYSQFTTMLRLIEQGVSERNWSYAYLDGSTKNREEVVQSFQEGDKSIFLISLKAGGVGLNLTAADYVFLYDPWWNEAVEAQAIDRAHRHGRKDTVIAKRYVTMSSIEEKMMHLKSYKSSLAKDLFQFEETQVSLDDLYDLLSSSIIS